MSHTLEGEKSFPSLPESISRSQETSALTQKEDSGDLQKEITRKKEHGFNSSMHSTETAKESTFITGIPLYLVILATTLAASLLFLDTAIIASAIPRITDEFNSLPDVGWYGSAYQLGSAAFLPLSGKIYTQFSTKWSFLAFFAIFEFGSLFCGTAQSSVMLIVGRAIAGAGGFGLISGALTIIASCLPLDKRAVWTGVLIGASQMGIVLGPILGGALTEYRYVSSNPSWNRRGKHGLTETYSTWRWCFYINLPVGGLVALLLIVIKIPDQIEKLPPLKVLPHLHHHLDLIGFALFASAVIQLLLAVQYGENKFSWNSSTIIGLFCGSGVTFIVWSVWNWRLGDSALIPVSIITKRPVWTSSLTQAFFMTVIFIATYFLPLYFQTVQDTSSLNSGIKLLPSIVSQLIFAIVAGALGESYLNLSLASSSLTGFLSAMISLENGLRYSVRGSWHSPRCDRLWPLHDTQPVYPHWSMVWIPNPCWRRPRHGYADGAYTILLAYFPIDTVYSQLLQCKRF